MSGDMVKEEGCTSPAHSKGLCMGHYGQQRRGEPLTQKKRTKPAGTKCSVVWCDRRGRVKGLCNHHNSIAWRFNLSTDDIVELLSQPCAICGSKDRPQIDHDHSCCAGNQSCGGCVRGVLCALCNNLVARLENDPRTEAALKYIAAKV